MEFNLYGCTECPKCGRNHRYSLAGANTVVFCDDCGFTEARTSANFEYELGGALPDPIRSARKNRRVVVRAGLAWRRRHVRGPHCQAKHWQTA